MKVLHYVLIAKHLTGDSEVCFFKTRDEAKKFYLSKTKPLLDVCLKNNLEEDEVYSFGQTKDSVRFDSGFNSELDALLNECNHYYRLAKILVNDDITHYVVQLSEWVDESTIAFYTKEKATKVWNDLVDDNIELASNYQAIQISRYDQTTWEDKSGMTLFMETHYDDYSDAYFGYSSDYTWTIRIGKIEGV